MIITWAGYACFKIEGTQVTLALDPFFPKIGMKLPKISAEITISTKNDDYHGNISGITSKSPQSKVLTEAGEYEVKDVLIYGTKIFKENGLSKEKNTACIYRIQIDGVHIVHLGALSFPLKNSQLDHLDKTDILLIPVGGARYLSGKESAELVNQIEPRIVIPTCYKTAGMKDSISTLNDFCKEIGICPKETIPKFKITKKDLPQDETKVVLLDIL